jgi:excisionase family DNA binding protein
MTMAEKETPLLITVREAAERINLSRDTVYDLIARGEIPSKRVGRALRVPVKALEKWAQPDVE